MQLTVVTGRANSGKTRFLHEEVARGIEAGECPTLLVPTFPDAVRVETELADKGLSGIRVVAFDRYLSELWRSHGDGRRFPSRLERRALMSEAIEATSVIEHDTLVGCTGFRDMLGDIAGRLSPDDTVRASGLSHEDREIASIIVTYRALCQQRGIVEPLGAASVLAQDPPIVEGPVVANRFASLSRSEELLLTGLARRNAVTVALTWEQGHPATEAVEPLLFRLLGGGARHVVAEGDATVSGELTQIERQLYRPSSRVRATGEVSIASATDEISEAGLVGDIVRAHVCRGVPPNHIAVVFRDPARRSHALSAIADKAGAGVHLDILVPFSRTPYGAAFLALLDTVSGRVADRRRMLAFLATPYSGCSLAEVGEADIRWRRGRVEGMALLEDVHRVGTAAARAVELARSVVHGPLTESTEIWQELADTLLASAQGIRPAGSDDAALDVAAHTAVCDAMTAALRLESPRVSAADVIETLREAKVGPLPAPSAETVVVTEAKRLQGRRFDVVVVAGLSSREFSPLKAHSAAQVVAERLGAPAAPDDSLLERSLFYSVVTRARIHLALVHPASIPGDEEAVPSTFINEVLDLYRTDEERMSGVPPKQGPTRERMAYHQTTRDPEQDRPHGGRTPRVPRNTPGATRGGAPGADFVRAQLDRTEHSVSEIETYLACPFKWFITHVVRARDVDRELGVAELGSLAHRLLAGFYGKWRDGKGRSRVTSATVEEALSVLADIEETASTKVHPRDLAERLAVTAVHERARAVVRDDATFLPGFEPVEHEFAFGVAVERPFEFGSTQLVGTIDRIDASPDALVVTDYKSGSSVSGHKRFSRDGLVQLPVYAAAANHFFERPVVGAVYRSLASLQVRGAWVAAHADLSERGVSTDSVDGPGFAALLVEAEERTATAVRGMREGRISVGPSRDGSCRFCLVSDVCEEARSTWVPS